MERRKIMEDNEYMNQDNMRGIPYRKESSGNQGSSRQLQNFAQDTLSICQMAIQAAELMKEWIEGKDWTAKIAEKKEPEPEYFAFHFIVMSNPRTVLGFGLWQSSSPSPVNIFLCRNFQESADRLLPLLVRNMMPLPLAELIRSQVHAYEIAQFQEGPGKETEEIIYVGEDDHVIMAEVGHAWRSRGELSGSLIRKSLDLIWYLVLLRRCPITGWPRRGDWGGWLKTTASSAKREHCQ